MGILPFTGYQGPEVELRKPFSSFHLAFSMCQWLFPLTRRPRVTPHLARFGRIKWKITDVK